MSEAALTPFFFFDLLHADGVDLLAAPGRVARPVIGDDAPRAFVDDAVGRGHEGMVAKSPDAVYDAGRRGGRVAEGQAAAHA